MRLTEAEDITGDECVVVRGCEFQGVVDNLVLVREVVGFDEDGCPQSCLSCQAKATTPLRSDDTGVGGNQDQDITSRRRLERGLFPNLYFLYSTSSTYLHFRSFKRRTRLAVFDFDAFISSFLA